MDSLSTLSWLRERFPGITSNPFWQLFYIHSDPYGFFDLLRREHGDVFKLNLPGLEPAYVISDPEAVRQILTGSYEDFGRTAGSVNLFLGPGSIILQDGEPHKLRRKLLNPAFNAETVRGYGPTMLATASRVLSRRRPGEVFSMLEEMADITLRVIIRCVFGVEEGPRLEQLRKLIIEYMRGVFSLKVILLGSVLGASPTRALLMRLGERARRGSVSDPAEPSRLPILDVADRLGAILGILDVEIERCISEGPEKRRDVLAMMLQMRFEDGQPMDRSEMLEQLMTLLIGGYETTSVTLTWAVHCLLEHPEVMAKARAEAEEAVRQGFDGTRVRDLTYIGAVMTEAMRFYPIVVAVTRRLKKPMTVGGRTLPAGALVSPSVSLMQRSPELWQDADKFIPERMLEKRPPPHLFFPFGASVWRCIGAAFAEHEMRVVMTHLLARFELTSAEAEPARPMQRGVVVSPSNRVLVRVERIHEDAVPSGG